MTRVQFAQLVAKYGGRNADKPKPKPKDKGGPPANFVVPKGKKAALEQELLAYFRTKEGQDALRRAPRIYEDEIERHMTAEEAVRLLLDEVDEE